MTIVFIHWLKEKEAFIQHHVKSTFGRVAYRVSIRVSPEVFGGGFQCGI